MVGYIGYSVLLRLGRHGSPTPMETGIVVLASLVPDLVDKPLAWQYNLFTSGHALAHSVFVAIPVVIVVALLARRGDDARVGVAFGAGYLLHLAGDVVPQYLRGEGLLLDRVLWPVRQSGSGYEAGFVGELRENLVSYAGWILEQLASGDPDPYLVGILGITGLSVLLWVDDGMPIGREVYAALRAAIPKDGT